MQAVRWRTIFFARRREINLSLVPLVANCPVLMPAQYERHRESGLVRYRFHFSTLHYRQLICVLHTTAASGGNGAMRLSYAYAINEKPFGKSADGDVLPNAVFFFFFLMVWMWCVLHVTWDNRISRLNICTNSSNSEMRKAVIVIQVTKLISWDMNRRNDSIVLRLPIIGKKN